jgi:hypothetical protein
METPAQVCFAFVCVLSLWRCGWNGPGVRLRQTDVAANDARCVRRLGADASVGLYRPAALHSRPCARPPSPQWLRDKLNIIESAADIGGGAEGGGLIDGVDSTRGLYFVPAFTGVCNGWPALLTSNAPPSADTGQSRAPPPPQGSSHLTGALTRGG